MAISYLVATHDATLTSLFLNDTWRLCSLWLCFTVAPFSHMFSGFSGDNHELGANTSKEQGT